MGKVKLSVDLKQKILTANERKIGLDSRLFSARVMPFESDPSILILYYELKINTEYAVEEFERIKRGLSEEQLLGEVKEGKIDIGYSPFMPGHNTCPEINLRGSFKGNIAY